jgi:integrase/recombinase XerD
VRQNSDYVSGCLSPLKNRGNGRAKVLSVTEVRRLLTALEDDPRDAALFAICFFTACRISEALHLETSDIVEVNINDVPKQIITFRRQHTKGKLKTRTIPAHPALEVYLEKYKPKKAGALFPGQLGRNKYLSRASAHRIFEAACQRAGIKGASTHSCRRSALSFMSANGIPLREIQEVSGHADLGTLQRYLEVSTEQVIKAVNAIWL